MLLCANVIQLKGLDVQFLRHAAVFAATTGPVPDLLATGNGHGLRPGRLEGQSGLRLHDIDETADTINGNVYFIIAL